MTIDYAGLGFKAGIEIHQQLDTGKLFCRCRSIVHDSNPDIHFSRKLIAREGEAGKTDIAAISEMKKGKSFFYEACSTSSCLVEADEEPPLNIDKEALQAVLQIAQLVHAILIDEIQVMRKIVVDGSNVSGFQRTALVAVNGFIETSQGKVSIPTINIEEESARKIETTDTAVKYRLDRLGVPLIEIATGPELKNPEHVKEAAEKIGMILRSTGKMKRGIGTIRQDVNVSIKGGARTEIKGFQDLRSIPKVVEYEIERQQKIIQEGMRVASEVRKAEPDLTTSFLRPMPGASRMYPETDIPTIRIEKEMISGIEKVDLIEDIAHDFAEKYKLDKDIATKIAKSGQKNFFDALCKKYKEIKPSFIADTLLSSAKQIKQKWNVEINPSEDDYDALFASLNAGKIAKESVLEILKEAKPVKDVINKFTLMSDTELEKELQKIISENKNLPPQALIGKAMGALRGKAAGQKIVEMLNEKRVKFVMEEFKKGELDSMVKSITKQKTKEVIYQKGSYYSETILASTQDKKMGYLLFSDMISINDVIKEIKENKEKNKGISCWAAVISPRAIPKPEILVQQFDVYIIEFEQRGEGLDFELMQAYKKVE